MKRRPAVRLLLVIALAALPTALAVFMVAWILDPIPDRFDSVGDAIDAVDDAQQATTGREIDAMEYLMEQPSSVVGLIETAIVESDSEEQQKALFSVLASHPSDEASAALLRLEDSSDPELRRLSQSALKERSVLGTWQP